MPGSSSKYVYEVKLHGTEKRYKPSKHYVYILNVTWSNETTFPIYRKYSEFYDFHLELIDQFPNEAGVGGRDRTLPYLPAKNLFSRNEIQKVAVERKIQLGEYCSNIIALETKISQDDLVLEFFEAKPSDIKPPKDAKIKPKGETGLISSLALILPKILQKDKRKSHDSPTVINPDDLYVSGPLNFDVYYVIADYKANGKGEINLGAGEEVEVIEKNDNGWWLISSCGVEQGWAPASFLEPLNVSSEIDDPEPLYNGETYVTLAEYEAELEDEISFPKGVIVEALHKLLDGWWIISYKDKVGHAPATYLAECHNPYVVPPVLSRSKKKPKMPTQRRCTIKNAQSKWTDVKLPLGGATGSKPTKTFPAKDLTLYRKMSTRISQKKLENVKAKHSRIKTTLLIPHASKKPALPLLPPPSDNIVKRSPSPISSDATYMIPMPAEDNDQGWDRRRLPIPPPSPPPEEPQEPAPGIVSRKQLPPLPDDYYMEEKVVNSDEDVYMNDNDVLLTRSLGYTEDNDYEIDDPDADNDPVFDDKEEYINVDTPIALDRKSPIPAPRGKMTPPTPDRGPAPPILPPKRTDISPKGPNSIQKAPKQPNKAKTLSPDWQKNNNLQDFAHKVQTLPSKAPKKPHRSDPGTTQPKASPRIAGNLNNNKNDLTFKHEKVATAIAFVGAGYNSPKLSPKPLLKGTVGKLNLPVDNKITSRSRSPSPRTVTDKEGKGGSSLESSGRGVKTGLLAQRIAQFNKS